MTDRWTTEDVERATTALEAWNAEWNGEPEPHRDAALAVLAALADAERLQPVDAEPDLWQYGIHDKTTDEIVPLQRPPRYIFMHWFRRPMRAVGSWQLVQPEETSDDTEEK